MALAHKQFDALDSAGNLLTNVQVSVEIEGGSIVPLYSDRDGTTPIGNPVTFVDGKIDFYCVGGAYKITMTQGAYTRVLRYVAIGTKQEQDQGVSEVAGFGMQWEAGTAAPPSAGGVRANNAALNLATSLFVSEFNLAGSDIAARLGEMTTGDRIVLSDSEGHQASWTVNTGGVTDSGAYRTIAVTGHAGETTLTVGIVGLQLQRRGAAVDAGVVMTFDTATAAADPGAGKFRLNNATHASATAAYIDNVEALAGTSITALLDSWDDSTATIKGTLKIASKEDLSIFRIYNVTGSVVDSTGYRTVTVAYVTGAGTLPNGTACALSFIRAGDAGTNGSNGTNGTNGVDGKFSGTEVVKTSAYTALAADVGKTIVLNKATTDTLSFDAAATLGSTWMVMVKNIGAGTWTLDPNGAEQIDGATTVSLAQNESVVVSCNGTALRTLFRGSARADVIEVATRTALKALDTTTDTVAILTEAGREGTFIWKAGNYSTQVAADTLEGIYVKATAVASSAGAWVRSYSGAANVMWWGATGDNTTDDSAAINAAIQLLAPPISIAGDYHNRAPVLGFPAGNYKITTEIAINNNLILQGIGSGPATIRASVSGSAHSAAFYLGATSYLSNNNGYWAVDFRNMTVIAVTGNYALLSHGIRTVRLDHSTFQGGALYTVRIEQAWAISYARGCSFIGTGVAGQFGLFLSDRNNEFTVDNNYFAGYSTATSIALQVRDSVGVRVINNDFEYNYNQILFYSPTYAWNSAFIDGNWIEGATGYSIKMDNSAQGGVGVSISRNSIYGTPDGSVYLGTGGSTGAIEGAVVEGNTFNSPSTLNLSSAATVYREVRILGNYPAAINRPKVGVTPLNLFVANASGVTGSDVNTAQPVFGSANDALTVEASTTYEFEAEYFITRAAGSTSHTMGVLFGGTATFTSVGYLAQVTNPTGNALANVQQIWASAATLTTLTAANTSTTENLLIKLKGRFRVNAAGTLIPQFQYSAAPGGAPTIGVNSGFRAWAVGSDTVVSSGPWS